MGEITEFKELQELDHDEDEMREHKLKKARHHLKELEVKYHALEKDHALLIEECASLRQFKVRCMELEEKCKTMDIIIHEWEEKFHRLEAKYFECQQKITVWKTKCSEFEVVIKTLEEEICVLKDRCNHLSDDLRITCEERDRLLEMEIMYKEIKITVTRLEERCKVLDLELCECRDKWHMCRDEFEKYKRETHDYFSIKEMLTHGRTELTRVRKLSKLQIAKLVERIVHLSKCIKELDSCFKKMGGL